MNNNETNNQNINTNLGVTNNNIVYNNEPATNGMVNNSINNQTTIIENSNINNPSVPVSNNVQQNVNFADNTQVLHDTVNQINDKQVETVKQKKKASINISPELKTAIVLALIILVFIWIMPLIFDLFN